jgi:hypothetical protein
MDRPKTQKAFKRIQEACQLIARSASPGVVVDTLFVALLYSSGRFPKPKPQGK